MKSIFITIVTIFLVSIQINTVAQKQKETIKVWGSCGMCQKKIEKAAKDAGAIKASWSPETHELNVVYKSDNSSSAKIQQSIAAVGYDTQDFSAPDAVYDQLHGCCKYERKATTGAGAHSCCADSSCGKGSDACKEKGCCLGKSCCKY